MQTALFPHKGLASISSIFSDPPIDKYTHLHSANRASAQNTHSSLRVSSHPPFAHLPSIHLHETLLPVYSTTAVCFSVGEWFFLAVGSGIMIKESSPRIMCTCECTSKCQLSGIASWHLSYRLQLQVIMCTGCWDITVVVSGPELFNGKNRVMSPLDAGRLAFGDI